MGRSESSAWTSRRKAKALNERYDVARARNEVSNAATNVEFFKNQKLPDVSLETSYRGSGLGGRQLLRTGAFPGVVTGRLNIEQLLGQRRAVERDEGSASAGRRAMDEARDDLFAGAQVAGQQHGRLGLRYLRRLLQDTIHSVERPTTRA